MLPEVEERPLETVSEGRTNRSNRHGSKNRHTESRRVTSEANNAANRRAGGSDEKASERCLDQWLSSCTAEQSLLLKSSAEQYQQNTEQLWQAEGGVGSIAEVARYAYELAPDATARGKLEGFIRGLRRKLQKGELVGYKAKSSWMMPFWQIDQNHSELYPGIGKICLLFGNAADTQEFMVATQLSVSDKRPLDLLRANKTQELIALAKRYLHYS